MTGSAVTVELLVVPDCPHERPARELLRATLDSLGMTATAVTTCVVDTHDLAERRGFVGSPTVLINGTDPFEEPGRPEGLACRVYRNGDGVSGLPEPSALQAALVAADGARR